MMNNRVSSDWLRVALLLSEISRSMTCPASIQDRHHRKRSVLPIKDKNEVADDIVFQMISKSVVSRLNVVF